MSLEYLLSFSIAILGFGLGIMLLNLGYKYNRGILFLGIFFIIYGIDGVIRTVITDVGLHWDYEKNILLIPLYQLICLYLYASWFKDGEIRKISWYIFIPVLIDVSRIFIINLFQWSVEQEVLLTFIWEIFLVLFAINITIVTLKKINSILRDEKFDDRLNILWLKKFIKIYLYIMPIAVIIEIVTEFFSMHLVLQSSLSIVFMGYVFFNVLLFGIIAEVNKKRKKTKLKEKGIPVNILKNINCDKNVEYISDIEKIILEEKLFLNNKLTVIDVSNKIGIHPSKLSAIINNLHNENFNSYVNNFRIDYAKKLLITKGMELSIEGIALESGFKSRSSFYNAFKKKVNMTPSRYKDNTLLSK